MALVRVLTPDSEPQRLAVVAMLEAHEIPCFVHNLGFASLYPGPQIENYNTRSIMVPEEHVEDALELLRDFLAQPDDPAPAGKKNDILRMLLELILFHWFIPGRHTKR